MRRLLWMIGVLALGSSLAAQSHTPSTPPRAAEAKSPAEVTPSTSAKTPAANATKPVDGHAQFPVETPPAEKPAADRRPAPVSPDLEAKLLALRERVAAARAAASRPRPRTAATAPRPAPRPRIVVRWPEDRVTITWTDPDERVLVSWAR